MLPSFKPPLPKLTFCQHQASPDQLQHPNLRLLANSHLALSVDPVSMVQYNVPRRRPLEKECGRYSTLDPSSGGKVWPNPLFPLHPTDAPTVISFIADSPAPYNHGLMNPIGGLFCAMRAALTCPTMPAQMGAAALLSEPRQPPSLHTHSQSLNNRGFVHTSCQQSQPGPYPGQQRSR